MSEIEPVERRMGWSCHAHQHKALVPIHRHHVWPLGEGGPDIPGNLVDLCANAHESVHHVLRLAEAYGGFERIPWKELIHYGPGVRRIALLGWQRMQRQAM